jgi:E3 ubiquitin-protein ligase MARCH6
MVGDERHHHGRSPIERARRKAKMKEENEDPLNPFDGMRAHNRRRLYPKGSGKEEEAEEEKYSELERMKRKSFSRRVYAARLLGARRRAALTGSSNSPTPMNVDPAFDFTFKAELPQAGRRSNSEPWPKQSRSTEIELTTAATSQTPIFPPVALEPPRGSIPFSFDRLKTPSPLSSPTTSADEGSTDVDPGIKLASSSSSLSQDKARRPPLPTTSLGPAASFVISPPRTPLDSPSLATYRAPEELEAVAGPSGLNDYFDREQEENSEIGEDSETEEDIPDEKRVVKDQMDQYFEELDVSGGRASLPELMAYSDTEEGDEDREEGDENDQSQTDEDSMDSDDEDDDEADEEANRLMVFNEDDWAREAQAVQQPAAGVPGEGVAAPAQEGVEAGQPPGGLDLNEEVEGNVEDDMDGAMEGESTLFIVFDTADSWDV